MSNAPNSMAGKICLVTGATAGIGRATAHGLAAQGASVVIVGRSRERCEAAVEAIRRETGNPSVSFLTADLSSQAEVRRLASEFRDQHSRLDILVNNAGALFATRRESVDGIEMTLALNHLGYFLLTNLLLDTIKASAPARIVNVSSDAHEMVRRFDFNDPQARKRWGFGTDLSSQIGGAILTFTAPYKHPGLLLYAQSKLANLLFTFELARRLEGTGVTVNAVHPGFVATSFTSGNGIFGWFMRRWSSVLAIGVDQGAKTSIYVASSPDVEGVTGKYYSKEKEAESSCASHDEEAARRLWSLSEQWTAFRIPSSDPI